MGSGFTAFVLAAVKTIVIVAAIILIGGPFITGIGLSILLAVIRSAAAVLLGMLASPLGLFVAGAIVWTYFGVRRRREERLARISKQKREAEAERQAKDDEIAALREQVAQLEAGANGG